jgi:hypothetical protein
MNQFKEIAASRDREILDARQAEAAAAPQLTGDGDEAAMTEETTPAQ